MEKVKLFVIGDAVTPTGFSRVLHSIIRYLPEEEYDISWLGINYSGDPHSYTNLRIYPANVAGNLYGMNRVEILLKHEKPDIVFILNDAWIIDKYLDAIRKAKIAPKIVVYFPVDAEDHDEEWYQNFDFVDRAFTYTEFGKKVAEAACTPEGKENSLFKFEVIPHGVDTDIFYKITDRTKQEIKKGLLARPTFYEDSFVVLNGNRNQPRKRVDLTMQAFQLFAEGKPENVMLYLHMGVTDDFINIAKYAKRLGISKRLVISGIVTGVQTVSDRKLNEIYNVCDVGVNTGLGEGWGLVNIEHAVTGAPQVVTDCSALTELYEDCGLLVPTSQKFVQKDIMTTGYLVKPEDVAEKLQMLYSDPMLYESLSHKSINKFTSEDYSWKLISEKWDKVFKEVISA